MAGFTKRTGTPISEACAFFNCLQGTGKDRINLNEYGFTLGGPVLKNKLFFFESFEFFDLPQTFPETGTWLTPAAANGLFTYNGSSGVKTVNLYQLAAQENPALPAGVRSFPTSGDPTLAKTYALIQQLIGNGTEVSRIATNNDYNRENFTWGAKAGVNNRKFQAARIDYNLTEKAPCQLLSGNYQINDRTPDRSESRVRNPAGNRNPAGLKGTLKASTASTGRGASDCVRSSPTTSPTS